MPFEGITQIPYHPCGKDMTPLTNRQVNELLLHGKPYLTDYASTVFLRRSEAPFNKVPCVSEFYVTLEGRKQKDGKDPTEIDGRLLTARFRPDIPGIEQGFTRAPTASQPKRHVAAYAVSMNAGVEIVPITVQRNFSYLREHIEMNPKNPLAKLALAGMGTLTASFEGESLFVHDFNTGKRYVREDIPFKRKTFVAALLFDILVGSGQRDAKSYKIDEDGRVRTIYHHEAFTYTAKDRLCEHLSQEFPEISTEFWKALAKLTKVRELEEKNDRLTYELSKCLDKDGVNKFFTRLELLLSGKRVCGEEITVC
ncbi:hypothetical protein GF391_02960 [Candidatus Uhrbacteria bacterium]|nr:hypothetical protein [Candidatus Uhrbacteria bacterium]